MLQINESVLWTGYWIKIITSVWLSTCQVFNWMYKQIIQYIPVLSIHCFSIELLENALYSDIEFYYDIKLHMHWLNILSTLSKYQH